MFEKQTATDMLNEKQFLIENRFVGCNVPLSSNCILSTCMHNSVLFIVILIWATSWENLFMAYGNNKGADQPVHPQSLISAFIFRCLDRIILKIAKSKISRL